MIISRDVLTGAVIIAALLLPLPSYAVNDIPADAAVLSPTGSTSGTMLETAPGIFDNYDWYVVTITTEGTLRVSSQSSGGLDLQVYLYHNVNNMQDGNSSGTYIGGGGSASLDTVVSTLRPCTVYIQMIRRSNTGSYSLTSTFSPAALATDSENNDTPKVANTLNANGTTTGHLGYYSFALGTDTYDWYKVVIPGNGKYTIMSTTSDGDLDLQLYIYRSVADMQNVNSSGNYIGGGGDSLRDTVIDFLRAQTAYIQVIKRSGTGSYSLTSSFTPAALDDDAENNDTPKVANVLAIDASETGHMGYFSVEKGIDTYDWYRITTPVDGRLTVTSQTSDGNLDLQLYIYRSVADTLNPNPSGNYIGGGGTQLNDTASSLLDPRTVHLQVIRRSGLGSYTLTTSFTPASFPNDKEPNDIPAQADSVNADGSLTGHLGYFKTDLTTDTYDWYKITIPSPRTLRFISRTSDGDLDVQLYIYSVVGDMNTGNPSGTWVGGSGTLVNDTVSLEAPSGTYYLQTIRRAGAGSYALACGSGELAGTSRPEIAGTQKNQGPFSVTTAHALIMSYPDLAPGSMQFLLYTMQGRLVASENKSIAASGPGTVSFGIQGISTGRYVLQMRNGGRIDNRIVRIQRR